ncbi:hypothetical protein HPT27_06045 [Permianibacter sp. IMCC34836]|uniref:chitinase N-terminal domain-containing protein n=1 Tax=Permianibacter fluminis TaxID=2738515 RepID=UPI0015575673|nr:chitinase N-terminal domain-containing protein [Permianibacter fluminis]NQD36578.1 hypothetical protein [Permianibacter fluminis]
MSAEPTPKLPLLSGKNYRWLLVLASLPVGMAMAAPTVGNCPLFPDDAIFNTRIDDQSRFPTHAMSATWINQVGANRPLHLDWGRNEDQQQWQDYYGIPFNVIDGTAQSTLWPVVSFDITDPRAGNGDGEPGESDCAVAAGAGFTLQRDCSQLAPSARKFPFPLANLIKAEYGSCNDSQQCGDRHVLIVEQGSCRLWESYFSYQVDQQWYAYSTAAWQLDSNAMRPDGWTSGDAAGLPILPLLVRVDEAEAGLIEHAIRVTFDNAVIDRAYVWPARHYAGGANANAMPFGALLRLKSDTPIPANWSVEAKAIATAMKRYGLYVADIGQNLFVQGEPSARWDEATWDQLQTLRMAQFEFVDLSGLHAEAGFDPDSFAVPGNTPPPANTPAPALLDPLPASIELVNGSATVTLHWQAQTGVRANRWQVLVNNVLVHEETIASGTDLPAASYSHVASTSGWLALKVRLCADQQCSDSATRSVLVQRPLPAVPTIAMLAASYDRGSNNSVTVPVNWQSAAAQRASTVTLLVNGAVAVERALSAGDGPVSGELDYLANQDAELTVQVRLCNERCVESTPMSTRVTSTPSTPASSESGGSGAGSLGELLASLLLWLGCRRRR